MPRGLPWLAKNLDEGPADWFAPTDYDLNPMMAGMLGLSSNDPRITPYNDPTISPPVAFSPDIQRLMQQFAANHPWAASTLAGRAGFERLRNILRTISQSDYGNYSAMDQGLINNILYQTGQAPTWMQRLPYAGSNAPGAGGRPGDSPNNPYAASKPDPNAPMGGRFGNPGRPGSEGPDLQFKGLDTLSYNMGNRPNRRSPFRTTSFQRSTPRGYTGY